MAAPVIAGTIVALAFFIGLGAWAAVAPLQSAAIAPGIVVVESSRKTLNHLEGGIVAEIHAREGQRVAASQLLIRLDSTRARANLQQLVSRLLADEAMAARLRAERDGSSSILWPDWSDPSLSLDQLAAVKAGQLSLFEARRISALGQAAILQRKIAQSEEEITGLSGSIASQTRELELLGEQIADFEKLLAKGLVDKPRVLELRRRQAQISGERLKSQSAIAETRQVIAEAQIRINEVEHRRVSEAAEQLQEVEREMMQLREQVLAARDVLQRTEIVAPLDGTIVNLRVHTVGGVVAPGEPLLDIIPERERLLVDVKIDPSDIDSVRSGQTADIRFSAFSQRDLQPLQGRVMSVSADHMVEENSGRSYYLGRIELLDQPEPAADGFSILPGMAAEAIIVTGEHTLFRYIARPIVRTFQRALRED
jgi:HlyD family type I secretion membrane fusion protein